MIYYDNRLETREDVFNEFWFLRPRNFKFERKHWQEQVKHIIIIYHSIGNFITSSNFYSKFWFRLRILRYRQFTKYAWADSKNFYCTRREVQFQIEWYAYYISSMYSLGKIQKFQKMINKALSMTGSEFLKNDRALVGS